MDDGYLSSHAEWQGRFWLPGRESEVQRGILSYEPDRGLRLSLIGGFDHAEWLPGPTPGTGVMSDRNTTWPVIHGSVGSAKVTLFDCIVQRSSFQMTVATVSRDAIKAEQQLMRGGIVNTCGSACFRRPPFQLIRSVPSPPTG